MVQPIKPLYLYQLTSCLHAGLQTFTAYVLQAFCFAQSKDHLWLRLMCFAFGSEQGSSVAKAYVLSVLHSPQNRDLLRWFGGLL